MPALVVANVPGSRRPPPSLCATMESARRLAPPVSSVTVISPLAEIEAVAVLVPAARNASPAFSRSSSVCTVAPPAIV
jgi:hypothetical protein